MTNEEINKLIQTIIINTNHGEEYVYQDGAYVSITKLLINVIQAQQEQIEELQQRISNHIEHYKHKAEEY